MFPHAYVYVYAYCQIDTLPAAPAYISKYRHGDLVEYLLDAGAHTLQMEKLKGKS
jgi:hypothetical protein